MAKGKPRKRALPKSKAGYRALCAVARSRRAGNTKPKGWPGEGKYGE